MIDCEDFEPVDYDPQEAEENDPVIQAATRRHRILNGDDRFTEEL